MMLFFFIPTKQYAWPLPNNFVLQTTLSYAFKLSLSWTTDPTEIRQFVCAFDYRPYCTMARTFPQPAFASTLKLAQRVVPFGPVTRQTIEGMSTLIEYLPTQTVAAPALGWVNFKAAFLTTSLGAGSFLTATFGAGFLTAIFGAAFFLGAACFLGVLWLLCHIRHWLLLWLLLLWLLAYWGLYAFFRWPIQNCAHDCARG